MKIFLIILVSFIYSVDFNHHSISDSLPANMPFSKKILWGENGLARKFNLAPESRAQEIKLRSEMLQLHQKLGLINLGLMGFQMYLGNSMYDKNDRNNASAHRYLGYSTFSIYMTTAGLQFLAPPAFRYSKGYSSIKVHRYLSYIHFAGMILTPISGYYVANNPNPNNTRPMELHKNITTITFSTYTLAFLMTLLP